MNIPQMYDERISSGRFFAPDIREHLPLLRLLAEKVNHITEFGVRCGNSSAAFLMGLLDGGRDGTLVGYDIDTTQVPPVDLPDYISWKVHQRSTVDETLVIDETDILFVDSNHAYDHVVRELEQHQAKVRRYIVMHDVSENFHEGPGPYRAMRAFLAAHSEWELAEYYANNNGLAVLARKSSV